MVEETADKPVRKAGQKLEKALREKRLRDAMKENMRRRKSQKRTRETMDKDGQDG